MLFIPIPLLLLCFQNGSIFFSKTIHNYDNYYLEHRIITDHNARGFHILLRLSIDGILGVASVLHVSVVWICSRHCHASKTINKPANLLKMLATTGPVQSQQNPEEHHTHKSRKPHGQSTDTDGRHNLRSGTKHLHYTMGQNFLLKSRWAHLLCWRWWKELTRRKKVPRDH